MLHQVSVVPRPRWVNAPFLSGREALEAFREHPEHFDVVITDHAMPKPTGLEFAKKLLDIRPDLPVILCSGSAQIHESPRLREIGVRECIKKPVVSHDLAKAIRRALEQRRAEEP